LLGSLGEELRMGSATTGEALSVPQAYPNNFKNRETLVSPIDFHACHVSPDRVVAAIDDVANGRIPSQ
jgi:hypothetical protein